MSDRLRATRSTLRPGEAPAETRGAEGLLPIAKGETSRRAFLASAGALGVAAVAAPDATGAEAGQAAGQLPPAGAVRIDHQQGGAGHGCRPSINPTHPKVPASIRSVSSSGILLGV